MKPESTLAEFVQRTSYDDLPHDARLVMKRVLLTVLGTAIAGASEDGCDEVRELVSGWGGTTRRRCSFTERSFRRRRQRWSTA